MFLYVPYSAKHWWHKTLANCQNIVLAKKTLANAPLTILQKCKTLAKQLRQNAVGIEVSVSAIRRTLTL